MSYFHIPVMLDEVLEYFNPSQGEKFIDCTLGGSGYTLALAKKVGPKGKVIAIDLDEMAIKNAEQEIKKSQLNNVLLVKDNFKNLKKIVSDNFPSGFKFNGIVLDLGLSSAQLDDQNRGFSFKGERPLNMSYDLNQDQISRNIINTYSLLELTRIFREYGEERRSYQIAKKIVQSRRNNKIETTVQLVHIIEESMPSRFYSRIHPATRIFQALRMETNKELSALRDVLPQATELLAPQGKLLVISFHSGEDRIVKRFFKSQVDLEILTKRPLIASETEVKFNPRSRSAKFRAALKIDNFN